MRPPARWRSLPRCKAGLQATSPNCQGRRLGTTTSRSRVQQPRETLPKPPALQKWRTPGSSSLARRNFSTHGVNTAASEGRTTGQQEQTTTAKEDTNGRWYPLLRERIGKCIIFGLSKEQLARTADLLARMSAEWEELVLHMDGYSSGHDGLRSHSVPWGDMDSFGHVNNVRYAYYAETSRINWITGFANKDPANAEQWRGLMTLRSVGLIMAELSTRFLSPVTYPDTLNAYHKVLQLPDASGHGDPATRSTMTLGCVILSRKQRRIVAQTTEKVVFYDYRTGRRTDAPDFARRVLEGTLAKTAGARARAALRIRQFREEVEGLEFGSWRREGAVEDLGSASVAK